MSLMVFAFQIYRLNGEIVFFSRYFHFLYIILFEIMIRMFWVCLCRCFFLTTEYLFYWASECATIKLECVLKYFSSNSKHVDGTFVWWLLWHPLIFLAAKYLQSLWFLFCNELLHKFNDINFVQDSGTTTSLCLIDGKWIAQCSYCA